MLVGVKWYQLPFHPLEGLPHLGPDLRVVLRWALLSALLHLGQVLLHPLPVLLAWTRHLLSPLRWQHLVWAQALLQALARLGPVYSGEVLLLQGLLLLLLPGHLPHLLVYAAVPSAPTLHQQRRQLPHPQPRCSKNHSNLPW